jgi:hypothetical protein
VSRDRRHGIVLSSAVEAVRRVRETDIAVDRHRAAQGGHTTMKTIVRAVLSAAVLMTALGAAHTPASANWDALLLRQEVAAITPQCRDFPDYPVVGRVAGMVGFRPKVSVSFVGCFPTFSACQRWVGPVSGRISGRIIRADCAPRY